MNTQVKTQKEVYFKVIGLSVGIRKRCRKESREYWKLGKLPISYTEEQLASFMLGVKNIIALEMKSTRSNTLMLQYTTSEGAFESHELFDKRHQNLPII